MTDTSFLAPSFAVVLALSASLSAQNVENEAGRKQAEESGETVLDRFADFDLEDVPLKDALAFLEEQFGIEAVADETVLNRRVCLKGKQIRLQSALNLLFEPLGMVWRLSGRRVVTELRASEPTMIRRYDAADLLDVDDSDEPGEELVEILQNIIDPDTWECNGGKGTIQFDHPGAFVIDQTPTTHRNIVRLLGQLREAKWRSDNAPVGEIPAAETTIDSDWAMTRRIENVLDTRMDFDYRDASLSAIARDLRSRTGANIVCSPKLDGDFNATLQAANLKLDDALELILEPHLLGYLVKYDTLVLTDFQNADHELFIRVYPAGDLVAAGATIDFAEKLVELIQNAVQPDSWEENGGTATIDFCRPAAALIVSTTQRNHRQIAELLIMLRKAKRIHDDREPASTPKRLSFGSYPEIDAALEERFDFRYDDRFLLSVMQDLSERTGLNVMLDQTIFKHAGLTDVKVTFEANDVTVDQALDRILKPLEMAYLVKHGSVLLTEAEHAPHEMFARTYPLSKLSDKKLPLPKVTEQKAWAELFINVVAPETWEWNGGLGDVGYFEPAAAFVISQSQQVHKAIDLLIILPPPGEE